MQLEYQRTATAISVVGNSYSGKMQGEALDKWTAFENGQSLSLFEPSANLVKLEKAVSGNTDPAQRISILRERFEGINT